MQNLSTTVYTPLDQQDPSQGIELPVLEKHGNWFSIILVSIYFYSLEAPPIISFPDLRWYFALGLALFAYVLQKKRLNPRAASPFWIVFGLSFLGALVSLVRSTSMDISLWNIVGMGISGLTFLLFLPVLSNQMARKVLLLILIITAFFSSIQIQQLLKTHNTLAMSTFSNQTGFDKNQIGFGLALAGTALFYFVLAWRPAKHINFLLIIAIRLVFGIMAIYFFYYLALDYARSGVLTALLGIGTIIIVVYTQSSNKKTAFLRIGVIVIALIFILTYLWPRVIAASPQWIMILEKASTQGTAAFGNRTILLEKGLFLVSENPFIGIGLGGSISPVETIFGVYPWALIHNTFLTDWVEKGILGLLSNIIWILMYLTFIKKKFTHLSTSDRIWLILFVPLFFEMNFLDMNSISITFLAIFSGIYYEQYLIGQSQTAHFLPGERDA
jgi:hypothetical protein